MKKYVVLAGMCLGGHAFAEKWNVQNNPMNFNLVAKVKLSAVLNKLPLAGELKDDRYGWSDSYWPSNLGGIAYRWNHPNPAPFKYKFHTKEQVLRMSEAQLSELSPAELYDISQADYNYTLTKKVLKTYSPQDLWWEGICHGWALAAVHYPEPDKTVYTSKDGVRVPFGASDVKALLSMHDAFNSKGLYVRVGARCGVEGKVHGEAFGQDGGKPMPNRKDANKDECKDVNAGAFHIVLTNMIGVNSQGFVADVDRFNDVWNQPVTGFKTTIHEDAALTVADLKNGISRKVRVTTTMIYGNELEFYSPESEAEGVLGFVSKEPVTGTSAQSFKKKYYEYILELDVRGNIIGGEWISDSRPDFLWLKAKDQRFLDGRFPLSGLNSIYKPVIR
jgi:hypothetical protein